MEVFHFKWIAKYKSANHDLHKFFIQLNIYKLQSPSKRVKKVGDCNFFNRLEMERLHSKWINTIFQI